MATERVDAAFDRRPRWECVDNLGLSLSRLLLLALITYRPIRLNWLCVSIVGYIYQRVGCCTEGSIDTTGNWNKNWFPLPRKNRWRNFYDFSLILFLFFFFSLRRRASFTKTCIPPSSSSCGKKGGMDFHSSRPFSLSLSDFPLIYVDVHSVAVAAVVSNIAK
jgi:hypothetical protein